MHANDVFSFFKNYFWHQHIKTIQTIQTILNFSKKKKTNFQIFWERSRSRVPKRFSRHGEFNETINLPLPKPATHQRKIKFNGRKLCQHWAAKCNTTSENQNDRSYKRLLHKHHKENNITWKHHFKRGNTLCKKIIMDKKRRNYVLLLIQVGTAKPHTGDFTNHRNLVSVITLLLPTTLNPLSD